MAFLDYDGLSHFKDKLDVEAEGKANVDGYYEELTAGSAEQLISTTYVEDNAPYTFRQSANGMDIGDRESDMLVGGTIAWNEMTNASNAVDSYEKFGVTFTKGSKGLSYTTSGTYSYTSGDRNCYVFNIYDKDVMIEGHKYLMIQNSKYYCGYVYGSGTPSAAITGNKTNISNQGGSILNCTTSGKFRISLHAGSNIPNDTVMNETIYICLFDLTQMFGSTIADYVYGLETATPGAGVAWFRKYFPKDYYAYNAGTLMSVNAYSHETTGFNQWDEQWELGTYNATTGAKESGNANIRSKNYIPVTPGTVYYDNAAQHWIFYYDADKNFISKNVAINNLFTTPANAHYITFYMNAVYGTTYNHDICINFHRDGSRDGEYEAYDRHSYNLDAELQLRGIPKLDTANNLYYDGDTYKSDGTVTRKYGIVDLGTLTWNISSSDYGSAYSADLTGSMSSYGGSVSALPSVVCNYDVVNMTTFNDTSLNPSNVILAINSQNRVYVRSASFINKTTTQIASIVSGVYLVYELATPTEETATGFTNPQIVSGWGTEEYIDAGVYGSTRDVSIPVGHESQYLADLRGKLQHLPNLAPANGLYGIRQTGTQMELEEIGSTIDHKADIDGNYEDMTVGNAEQLVATVGIQDEVPYNFRTSGGSLDIGDRETDKIVGGTIAWNQILPNGNFVDTSTWKVGNCTMAASNNVLTLTPNSGTVAPSIIKDTNAAFSVVANHKHFVSVNLKVSDFKSKNPAIQVFGTYINKYDAVSNSWTTIDGIKDSGSTTSARPAVYPWNTAATEFTGEESCEIKNFCLFDLTKMFGVAIADYIYSLEQANAGAGVAYFKSLFPKDYYAYNAGTLMSVNTSAHKMTGFNQWDEQSENGYYDVANNGEKTSSDSWKRCKNLIPCVPNSSYYFMTDYTGGDSFGALIYYDASGNQISYKTNNVKNIVNNTPDNCYYISFYAKPSWFNSHICINISWDGSRNGEYEPYVEYNYPLDSSLELRGIPKLDSGNKLYYDGDTYESDGTVTRRYGIMDMGTINSLNYNGTYGSLPRFSFPMPTMPSDTAFNKVRMVSTRYIYSSSPVASSAGSTTTGVDKSFCLYNGNVYLLDSSTTAPATLKASLSGVYMIYELATPTTESAELYQEIQIVNDFGTEEYVDYAYEQNTRDVKVPVGHSTFYAANLKAKLEMLPNSPSEGDGDYILRQTDGENEFVRLIIPNELPDAPTTDGAYTLKATVADGVSTLSWVSAT